MSRDAPGPEASGASERWSFDERLRASLARNLARFERRAATARGLRRAAVGLVLLDDGPHGTCFLITRRDAGLRRHAGQYALPGGRLDEGEDACQAARREVSEEVGITLGASAVLGLLDDYVTRSGFVITPVVLWGPRRARVRPQPGEVAHVYRVPLGELDRDDLPFLHPIAESAHPVLSLPLMGRRIYAPTAAVIYQMREVALFGRATRVAHFEQPLFAWR